MEKGRFEDISFDSIECYTSTFKRLVWKDHRNKTIAVIFFSFLIAFVSIIWGVIIPVSYFFYLLFYARNQFLKEFAEKNNLTYEPFLLLDDAPGSLFQVGQTRGIVDVITGTYNNQKARIFYYINPKGGESSTDSNYFTILEVFFDEINFPHILLQSRTMRKFGARERGEVKIALEEEFKKDYNLFIKEGYGIEAMQIFTKDFLRFLKKKGSDFSIELKKDRLYIYDDTTVIKKEQLKELYEVTEQIVKRITPLLNRMKNDFDALNPYFNE